MKIPGSVLKMYAFYVNKYFIVRFAVEVRYVHGSELGRFIYRDHFGLPRSFCRAPHSIRDIQLVDFRHGVITDTRPTLARESVSSQNKPTPPDCYCCCRPRSYAQLPSPDEKTTPSIPLHRPRRVGESERPHNIPRSPSRRRRRRKPVTSGGVWQFRRTCRRR